MSNEKQKVSDPIYIHPCSVFLSASGFDYHHPILYDPENILTEDTRLLLQKRFGYRESDTKKLLETDIKEQNDCGGTRQCKKRIVLSTTPHLPAELSVHIKTLWIISSPPVYWDKSEQYPLLYEKLSGDNSVQTRRELDGNKLPYDCHCLLYPRDINILLQWFCKHGHYVSFEQLYQIIPIICILTSCSPRKWKRKFCLLPH